LGGAYRARPIGHLPAAILTLVALVLVVVVGVASRGLWLLLVAVVGALVVLPAQERARAEGLKKAVKAYSASVGQLLLICIDQLQGNQNAG
jgi:heme O synthase-like polyprenyltransferase